MDDIEYRFKGPDASLSYFVERFYLVTNSSGIDKEMIAIPDGRIDVFFLSTHHRDFSCTLLGLETGPTTVTFSAASRFFGISFKLLAVEDIFNTSIAHIVNNAQQLPPDFLGMEEDHLASFETCCEIVSAGLKQFLKRPVDGRKQALFNLVYLTNGSLTVAEYSAKVFWSRRQINRYFNQTFGLPLKVYCQILRFRSAFQQIKEGRLYPEEHFSDQAHFSREVKRLAGVVPKELSRNKNDRFVQFSSLPKE